MKTKYQPSSIKGDDEIKSIIIKNDDGKETEIETDYILSFFGLIMKLGPISEWGLNMDRKTIKVNTENFETNKKGIFAIDICTFENKTNITGFQNALASVECLKEQPNENIGLNLLHLLKKIQTRLGVKNKYRTQQKYTNGKNL